MQRTPHGHDFGKQTTQKCSSIWELLERGGRDFTAHKAALKSAGTSHLSIRGEARKRNVNEILQCHHARCRRGSGRICHPYISSFYGVNRHGIPHNTEEAHSQLRDQICFPCNRIRLAPLVKDLYKTPIEHRIWLNDSQFTHYITPNEPIASPHYKMTSRRSCAAWTGSVFGARRSLFFHTTRLTLFG